MATLTSLPCDGCGQFASSEHIARRLRRLEWATRFRPVHLQSLLLGGISPQKDDEYLYCPDAAIVGEAQTIFTAAQVSAEGKSRESALTEFQKLGLMLTHVLDCPLDAPSAELEIQALLQKHLPSALTRIRRSLKPKRVFLLSPQLHKFADDLRRAEFGCPVSTAPTGAFLSSPIPAESEIQQLRAALAGANA